MSDRIFDAVPVAQRDIARSALAAAFGAAPIAGLQPVAGGASGASAYRVEIADRPYLLRIEGRRTALRNPHQYACMRIAADADIAPPLRHADDAAGVAIMDFVAQRPLADYPGGPHALARALGCLVAQLQATQPFPVFVDYLSMLARVVAFLRGSRLFAPGLLDRHAETFERIRAAYPWNGTALVSSHNDPNPRNILFDGERLWLIDWETAYRNDPLVDIAIAADQLAATPEEQDALLVSWLGHAPDRGLRARLALMRPLTRLYYAGLLFMTAAAAAPRERPEADLSALTPDEFRAAIAQGRLHPTAPETLFALGKMQLAGLLAAAAAPGFEEALRAARDG